MRHCYGLLEKIMATGWKIKKVDRRVRDRLGGPERRCRIILNWSLGKLRWLNWLTIRSNGGFFKHIDEPLVFIKTCHLLTCEITADYSSRFYIVQLVVEFLMYGWSILFGSERNEQYKERLYDTKNVIMSFCARGIASWSLVEFRLMRIVLT